MPVTVTPLTDPEIGASSRRLAWLARDADGTTLGSAFLRLFTRTGQNRLATLEGSVHPAERRENVGSLMLTAALDAARENGRSRVISHVQAGSPGDAFLSARGFRRVLALESARLSLPDADLAALTAIVERPHTGYRLASWEGMVPDELAETFVASRRAMDDTPTGGVDFGAVPWDAARVRAAVTLVEKRGDRLLTVVALDEADGTIAGFTELAVPGSGEGDATHYGTAVLPERRGNGLALWMKAETVLLTHERYPGLEGLLTDTADNNPHMRRVNDALGYRPTDTTTYEYQLDL